MSRIASFEIEFIQYLEENGTPVQSLPEWAKNADTLEQAYRWMWRTRMFDTKAISLQRTGQMGTYASCLGQEAIGTAIGLAMDPNDVFVPSYRETGTQLIRGTRMQDILLYWGGDERGSHPPSGNQDLPVAVPIASQCLHAVGVATAIQYRKQNRVVVCTLGDGGTSQGDFYEAINLAGVWCLPVIFVVSNNQWAISVPREAQSASETLAQKAIAAGIHGVQVDGNDYIAIRETLDQMLQNARQGKGACVIEALTYRLSDHTTADDASRYRDARDVEHYKERDPLRRMQQHLQTQMGWTDAKQSDLKIQCQQQIEAAVKEYLATEPVPPTDMFDYLYEILPKALQSQRAEVEQIWQAQLDAQSTQAHIEEGENV